MANEVRAAMIAAISAFVGTAVGAGATYAVAKATITANKQQAVDTFWVTQRQAAFSAFLTDAENFFASQYSYSVAKGAAQKNLGNMIATDVDKLATDDSGVALVGPGSISSITQEMSTLASIIAYKEGLAPTATPQPTASTIQSLTSRYDDDLKRLRENMGDVIIKS